MDNLLLYLLILGAIVFGWLLGRRDRTKTSEIVGPKYYQGLSYLLNEEPDRALTTFIENLEVTNDTLETHLALGGLLRRRGELDKAVVVHENILVHAKLSKPDMQRVQLELARDYLLAGLLDRAEELCVQLSQELETGKSDSVRQESLKITLEIYEREKEWSQAIEVAKLLAVGGATDQYEKSISHYYCEIAEELLNRNELSTARESLREAIGHDVNNPRASLVRSRIDIEEGHYDQAIAVLTRILDQNPVYLPESLETLGEAYRLGQRPQKELREYLISCLDLTPSISIVLMLAKSIRDEMGDDAVAKFIASHLKENPTIRGLAQLIDLHIDNTDGVAKENLSILRSFADALVADKPAYRCNGCGFEGKRMRWHCPVCKDWATIEPIFGLEGE
jgi:lipopolysaccharide biosynthesis regulator YciM